LERISSLLSGLLWNIKLRKTDAKVKRIVKILNDKPPIVIPITYLKPKEFKRSVILLVSKTIRDEHTTFPF